MISYSGSTQKICEEVKLEDIKIATEASKKKCLLLFVSVLCVALTFLLLVFVILYAKESGKTVYTVGKSVLRNHKLDRDISRAIVKGFSWLGGQQDKEGKWLSYHMTGYALSTLNLIGQDINIHNKCVDLKLALNYIKKLNGSFHMVNGGELAYIIIGLRSLCISTSQFMGTNLTDLLFKQLKAFPVGAFNHRIQYSLAVIALHLSNVLIPWSFARKLIQDGNNLIAKQHRGETLAFICIALSAVESYERTLSKQKLSVVKNTVRKILHKLEEDMFSKNSTMNLYAKSVVLQAITAVNKDFRVNSKKLDEQYQDLLSQQRLDGSFGNLGAVLHVLPALAGTSFLDILSVSCSAKNTTGNKVLIKVHINLEFEFGNGSNPSQQIVNILNGSTAFDALKAAAKLDACYGFTYRNTSYGPSIQSICNVTIDHAHKLYWMFYVNGMSASVGLASYEPKENDLLTMKYKKMTW